MKGRFHMAIKPKAKNGTPNNNLVLGIMAIALIAGAIFIFLNVSGITQNSISIDYSKMPVTRTDDGAFVLGNPEAPLTVVTWEDFFCSHCHDYEPTMRQFIKNYVETGKVKYEFRMLRTASPNDALFRLAQCVGEADADAFFKGREMLFDMTSKGWDSATSPRQLAADLGIEYSQILDCTSDAQQLATDTALAEALGAGGTPTLLIRDANGNFIPQSRTQLSTAPSYANLTAYLDASLSLQ
jgi:protein-disulfide isomerase